MNSQTALETQQDASGPALAGILQRKCDCGQHTNGGGECAACGEKRKSRLPHTAVNHQLNSLPSNGKDERRGRGQMLDLDTRAFMQARFGHDLSQLPVQADARCPMDEPCPEDPLVDYQGHGETSCDTSTGNMTTTLTEHCAGDCVAQHEAVHRTDRAPCCTKVKKCLDDAGGDATKRNACTTAFNTWYPKLSKWTECNAYTREVSCLTSFIATNCQPGGVASAACCTTLRGELTFAQGEKTSRCAGAVSVPCPL